MAVHSIQPPDDFDIMNPYNMSDGQKDLEARTDFTELEKVLTVYTLGLYSITQRELSARVKMYIGLLEACAQASRDNVGYSSMGTDFDMSDDKANKQGSELGELQCLGLVNQTRLQMRKFMVKEISEEPFGYDKGKIIRWEPFAVTGYHKIYEISAKGEKLLEDHKKSKSSQHS